MMMTALCDNYVMLFPFPLAPSLAYSLAPFAHCVFVSCMLCLSCGAVIAQCVRERVREGGGGGGGGGGEKGGGGGGGGSGASGLVQCGWEEMWNGCVCLPGP